MRSASLPGVPIPGGGRQTRDLRIAFFQKDGARAEKTDTADDLRADTRGVGIDDDRLHTDADADADDGGQCRTDRNEHMRAQSRRAAVKSAFKADEPAEHGGKQQPDDQDPDVGGQRVGKGGKEGSYTYL